MNLSGGAADHQQTSLSKPERPVEPAAPALPPRSVGPGYFPLPAWPARAACRPLDRDFGVRVASGNATELRYTVKAGAVEVGGAGGGGAGGEGGTFRAHPLTQSVNG